MGNDGTIWLPEQASTLAPEMDALFYFVYWASVVLFIGVVAAMMYFAYRYRRKKEDERPEPVKESKVLEISWIVVPTILVLILFNWGFRAYVNIYTTPPDAYEIQVRGWQWAWEFEYPDAGITIGNELHVPANRPVRLVMSSEDVLHSMFIPAFRVKQDVLPDRYTSLWFEATREGEYTIFCAEYCGTQHAVMDANVIVHPQDEFEEWLATGGGMDEDIPLPELGARLYEQQSCNGCHSLDGTVTVGPSFQGLYMSERPMEDGSVRTADENYLREAILEPNAQITEGFNPVMPPTYSNLSERQVSALIEFIKEQE